MNPPASWYYVLNILFKEFYATEKLLDFSKYSISHADNVTKLASLRFFSSSILDAKIVKMGCIVSWALVFGLPFQ